MNTLTLANGKAYDLFTVIQAASPVHFQGADRRNYAIKLDASKYAVDEISADFNNDELTKTVTITDDSGAYPHINYCLNYALGYENFLLTEETSTDPAVYVKLISVVQCELTRLEVQQDKLAKDSADTQDAITALAFGGVA